MHLDTGVIVNDVLKLYGDKQCNLTADVFYEILYPGRRITIDQVSKLWKNWEITF